MRLLLDTHALLWWMTEDPQLSEPARLAMLDVQNEVWVSAVSAWEIATKQRLGKLPDVPAVQQWFHELVAADGFQLLPITAAHALRAGAYDSAHRDPFDRMLAAQSELENLDLVSCDAALPSFGCRVFWS
jgi:PIN domain nuclease of toxin-antitoxin system